MTRIRFIAAIIALMAIAFAPSQASAKSPYKGEKTMGLSAGFASRNESAAAGIFFSYRFARSFVLAPSADYVFRNKDEDAFNIDLNARTPFVLAPDSRFSVYPLAGVGYSAISRRNNDILLRTTTDNRHRVDRFGINLGAGAEYLVSSTLALGVEAKWRWRSNYSTGLFTLSIGYRF